MKIDLTIRRKSSRVPELGKDFFIVVCGKCGRKGAKNYGLRARHSGPVIHTIEQARNFNVILSECRDVDTPAG